MTTPAVPAIGIDLGTTFSVVARLDERGQPVTLVNAEGDRVTPSVVLFDTQDVVVGKEAFKALATEADHVAECSKRDMGHRVFHKVLEGKQYPPEVIEAWILNKLRADMVQQVGPFSKVVITVPAYFDEVRRKATQDAGYMAGFDVMDIINEPTAAAVAFGFQQGYLDVKGSTDQPRRILVYDLGGGTFDVTVMEIRGTEFVALSTDGDVRLGGYDWDQRLVDLVAESFIREHYVDPREDSNTTGKLWRECEDAKRTLSVRNKASVACDYRGFASRVEISKQQFEEATQDLLDRTRFTTVQTLKAAGLEWSDIERVLLVGGSTRMPMVHDMLREISGKEPDASVAADEAVAHGAALRAGLLLAERRGQLSTFAIKNVNSHSLGVVSLDRAAAERDPHPAEYRAAGNRQADLQDPKGQSEVDPGADRRGGKPLGRRLHSDRQVYRSRPAAQSAGAIAGHRAVPLPAERPAEGPRYRTPHRPTGGDRDRPRKQPQQGAPGRLAPVHLPDETDRIPVAAPAGRVGDRYRRRPDTCPPNGAASCGEKVYISLHLYR